MSTCHSLVGVNYLGSQGNCRQPRGVTWVPLNPFRVSVEAVFNPWIHSQGTWPRSARPGQRTSPLSEPCGLGGNVTSQAGDESLEAGHVRKAAGPQGRHEAELCDGRGQQTAAADDPARPCLDAGEGHP